MLEREERKDTQRNPLPTHTLTQTDIHTHTHRLLKVPHPTSCHHCIPRFSLCPNAAFTCLPGGSTVVSSRFPSVFPPYPTAASCQRRERPPLDSLGTLPPPPPPQDPANAKGGKWTIRLRKGLGSRFWESIVMAIIGEQFDVSATDHAAPATLAFATLSVVCQYSKRQSRGRERLTAGNHASPSWPRGFSPSLLISFSPSL